MMTQEATASATTRRRSRGGSRREVPGKRGWRVAADDRLAEVGVYSPLRCWWIRRAVWRSLFGATLSSSIQTSIVAFHGSSTGELRGGGAFHAGGSAEASAWRAARWRVS